MFKRMAGALGFGNAEELYADDAMAGFKTCYAKSSLSECARLTLSSERRSRTQFDWRTLYSAGKVSRIQLSKTCFRVKRFGTRRRHVGG
jgi:hypothetical protein